MGPSRVSYPSADDTFVTPDDPIVEQEESAPRRVLVVDDNALNSHIARLMLERLGCSVDVAENGREAVAMTTQVPYDAVFMDCGMPQMNGYDASREIRRRENSGEHLPIIALTAHAMPGDRERCLESGMDDYITKPVSRAALEGALERWCPTSIRGGLI